MKKTFVKVVAVVDEEGVVTPKSLEFNDTTYIIDRVLDRKNCATFKVGGIGVRYTIRIGNNTTYLFQENGKWFVEEK